MKQIILFIFAMSAVTALVGMEDANDCLICLQPLALEDYRRLGCLHAYHQQCWDPWKFKERLRIAEFLRAGEKQVRGVQCPICKQVVDDSQTISYERSSFLKKVRGRLYNLFKQARRETA